MYRTEPNRLLTTEQIAQRYNKSLRWAQDLLAQDPTLALKVGREYKAYSYDVERAVQRSRRPGRPRRLTASEGELGVWTVDVAGDVRRAQTEEEMEEMLHQYIAWLEQHREVLRLQPSTTPQEIAFANIEQSIQALPDEQREAWVRVLQREVNYGRRRRVADFLATTYQANVKVRWKNDTDYCIELYASNDTEQEYPLAIIYEAAVTMQTCEACGQPFSVHEMEMVQMGGLSAVPPLCRACTRAWNAKVDRQPTLATAQQFEQFKRERSA